MVSVGIGLTSNCNLHCPHCYREQGRIFNCGGGCAARRRLRGRIEIPDEFCPVYRGKKVALAGRLSAAAKPLRTGSICTTIVRGI